MDVGSLPLPSPAFAMNHRILVVDDHAPWRRQIRSLLQKTSIWEASGEAADGWEAIAQTEALRPDLILLDVELPTLTGIDAAARILSASPDSRILFVSAHHSWDIVDAAMRTGARGYVLKTSAADELVSAMETVLAGGRFISAALTGRRVDAAKRASAAHLSRCHEACFYSDEAFLIDGYAAFVEAALRDGKATIFVAVDARRQAVYQRLQTRGVDVDLALEEGRLLPLDVSDALSSFIVDGWPNESRFWQAGADLLSGARRRARGSPPRVAACGDCAPSLVRDGRADAAIRLEHLWDDFARTYNVDIFCGYMGTGRDNGDNVFQRICAEHSAVHSR
jgi:DNA-binding NarL/FixJ family response regulator